MLIFWRRFLRSPEPANSLVPARVTAIPPKVANVTTSITNVCSHIAVVAAKVAGVDSYLLSIGSQFSRRSPLTSVLA
jgi:hypothetical protein